MAKGRPPTPTKSKIINGTFRKDRAITNEPEPTIVVEVPRPPSNLPAAGRRMWRQIAAEMVDGGILTVVDLPALEVCCLNYGIYVELWKAIRCMIVDSDTGRRRRRTVAEYLAGKNSQTMPEWAAMRSAFTTFKSYLIEFGFTPASRTRIGVPEKPGEELPYDEAHE